MVYKYQEKTIEQMEEAIEQIEKITKEHYRLHIGYRHTNNFDEENIPIFLEINGRSNFTQQTNMDSMYDNCYSACNLYYFNRVELFKDVFLDINKLIERVIKDNKKREEFHEELNKELKALNVTLKNFNG